MVVSAPRDGLPETALGGVSVRLKGGPLRYATRPTVATCRMVGESLSVCIHEGTRTALVTHPYGGLITFWNLDAGALVGALDLPHARGVTLTLDQRYFAVSYGPAASLLLIETSPLRPVLERDPGARRFSRIARVHLVGLTRGACKTSSQRAPPSSGSSSSRKTVTAYAR